jgi:O-antigen ligase
MPAELIDRERWDRQCERGILASVLAVVVFTPLAFGGRAQPAGGFALDFLAVNPFIVAQVLTMVAAVLWGVRLWLNPRSKLLWPPICWGVLAFTIYAIGRYFSADIEYVARQEVIRIIVYAFLFFVVLNNLHRQESVQVLAFGLIFLAMAISFFAVYQFLTDSDRVWHIYKPYKHRASGTYISPNHLGGFLEMLLPLALAFALVSRLKVVPKVFFGYAAAMMAAGILVTVSRGSWFSTALALLIFFGLLFFHERYRWPAFIFLFVLLFSLGFFFPKTYIFQARIKQLFAHGKLDDDMRFDLWRPAMKLWRENPVWGAGPSHYDFRFRKFRPKSVQMQPDRAHNDFLNAVVDWGLVGAMLMGAVWVMLYAGMLRTLRFVRAMPRDFGEAKSNKFAFVLGSSIGLTALLFHGMVDFNFHIPANAMIAVMLMALLSSHLRFATEQYWRAVVPWNRACISLVIVAGTLFVGQQAWRHARESHWLALASRASPYSRMQVQFLERAFAVEPKNFETVSAIGRAYLTQSKEGGDDYQQLAHKAMDAYEHAMRLNRWDGYGFLWYGLCLDWLGRWNESGPYFSQAEELDPNGYFTVANIGLHYVEMRNYAAAKPWLERSHRLQRVDNKIADSYLRIVNRRLIEAATNEVTGSLELRGSTAVEGAKGAVEQRQN